MRNEADATPILQQLWRFDAGSVSAFQNFAGYWQRYTSDASGRKLTEDAPRADKTAASPVITTWGYDAVGNVTSVTTPRAGSTNAAGGTVVTQFVYDALGRRTDEWSPSGDTNGFTGAAYPASPHTHWTYTPTGLVSAKAGPGTVGSGTNVATSVISYASDALGRVTGESWQGVVKFTYAYDGSTRRLLSEGDADSRLSYEYDAAGRVTRKVTDFLAIQLGGASVPQVVQQYGYDLGGRAVAELVSVGGTPDSQVETGYDALGRVTWKVQYSALTGTPTGGLSAMAGPGGGGVGLEEGGALDSAGAVGEATGGGPAQVDAPPVEAEGAPAQAEGPPVQAGDPAVEIADPGTLAPVEDVDGGLSVMPVDGDGGAGGATTSALVAGVSAGIVKRVGYAYDAWGNVVKEYRFDSGSGLPEVLRTEKTYTALGRLATEETFAPANLLDGDKNTYWSTDDEVHTPEFVLTLPRATSFNVVELRECLPLGQRIDGFTIDVKQGGEWVEYGKGSSIGHRYLSRGQTVTTDQVRVRITGSPVCPALSAFGLYIEPVILEAPRIARSRDGQLTIAAEGSATIHYTLDGTPPNASSPAYTRPFPLPQSATVKACLISPKDGKPGEIATTDFGQSKALWKFVSCSYQTPGSGVASSAIDDNPRTLWHTSAADGERKLPQELVIDMGETLCEGVHLPASPGPHRPWHDRPIRILP